MKAEISPAETDKKWTEIMGKLCDERYPKDAKIVLLQSVKDEDITGAMLSICVRELMRRALLLNIKGIDLCSTGSDKSKNSVKIFNISTAVAFVAAAGGVSIIKSGNQGNDILNALHINVCTNAAMAKVQHKKHNLCFIFSPAFLPALASLDPVRKALNKPTFLNLLEPLCNPAHTARQIMGVYGFQPQVAEAGRRLGRTDIMVVRSEDGLDKISLSDFTQIYRVKDGKIEQSIICSEDFGISTVPIEKLQGGSIEQNIAIIHAVLSGTKGSAADIVCLNAAAVFMMAGKAPDLKSGLNYARKTISDGIALKKLEDMKGT